MYKIINLCLGLGIVWGIIRLRQISEYHADIREFEHWKKVEKKEHAEKVKHWTNKDETVTLIGVCLKVYLVCLSVSSFVGFLLDTFLRSTLLTALEFLIFLNFRTTFLV